MSGLFIDADILAAAWFMAKASVLMAAAAVACLLIHRRASAAIRHLLWTLAVLSLLLLPALAAIGPRWKVALPLAGAISPPIAAPNEPPVVAPSTAAAGAPVGEPLEARSRAVAPNIGSIPGTPQRSQIRWTAVFLGLYAAGVLVLLIHMVAERLAIRRFVRNADEVSDSEWRGLFLQCARSMGVDRPVRLLRSREQSMPMAFGIRRPTILLPTIADTWSEDRRRAVLLHELAHVARHDCLTQMMAALACALYWMHPGVWWVAGRLRVERELACDDRVLKAGTRAREYAGHLLELAYALGGHRAPVFVVTMARPRQLEGRMLAVLDSARNRTTPGLQGGLAAAAMVALLLVPLAGAEATVVPTDADEVIDVPAHLGGDGPVPAGERTPFAKDRTATTEGSSAEASAAAEDVGAGTWEIRPSNAAGTVHLQLTERNSSSGSTVPIARLEGLSPAQLQGGPSSVHFTVRRDAGTFTFDGTCRDGVGAGTYTFSPSATFAVELEKRGLGRPTPADQYQLARHDVGLAFVNELTAQGYRRPDISELVRAGQHGVHLEYLRGMGELGYRLGALDPLITLRDHGVGPDFVRELAALGFKQLPADDLRMARDHGVTPDYVRALRELGYTSLGMKELVKAHDHGVSPEFVRELSELGYSKLPLEELIKTRDHGVSPGLVRDFRELGYRFELAQLITARDHGVSSEFIRELSALGYKGLPVDSLIRLRDHGVSTAFIRELKGLGYEGLSVDDLVGLRDHGVSAEKVRSANARAGTRLPVDMLRALADRGMK
jgi:beta-lactamase regulating signal transducer with metallopeptidase domain